MGACVSVDVGGGLPIEQVISLKPNGPHPPARCRSNLKCWRFFSTAAPLDVKSEPVDARSFAGFDASECYILLHTYRRRDEDAVPVPAAADALATGAGPAAGASVRELASSSEQCLSPRGLSAPFSGYDDCGPYPFEQHATNGPALAHDLYIWNGRHALALVKAVALTRCFELERALINDESGMIRHLHGGIGCGQIPATSLFRTDYDAAPADAGANHLMGTLCRHDGSDAIPCSSLLDCMLPGLTSLSSGSFPELQKALFAHLHPSPHVERDLGTNVDAAAGRAPAPPASPAAEGGLSSPGRSTGLPPMRIGGLGLGAATGSATASPALPTPPPPASLPASSARPARPGSAGGNGFKVAGLSSVTSSPAVEEDTPPLLSRGRTDPRPSAADAMADNIPPLGGLGGLGGLSGKKALVPLNLSGLASAYERGEIESDELVSKAEKLRHFSKICSQITPQLFLGADEVARDLTKLRAHGITHVLNTAGVACRNYHEGVSEIEYKTLHLYDSPRQDVAPVMYTAVEYIERAIGGGGKVFVHCHQGVSRSTTMVLAYLMWVERPLSFQDAFDRVRPPHPSRPPARAPRRVRAGAPSLHAHPPPRPPHVAHAPALAARRSKSCAASPARTRASFVGY